jgi:hypothetical protein
MAPISEIGDAMNRTIVASVLITLAVVPLRWIVA